MGAACYDMRRGFPKALAAAHHDSSSTLTCASWALLATRCGEVFRKLLPRHIMVLRVHLRVRLGAACYKMRWNFWIILPRHIMVLRVHLRARLGRCLLRGAARISGYSCLGTLGFIEYTRVRPRRCLLLGAEECAETLPRRTWVLRVHSCVPGGVCYAMRRVCAET